MSKNKENIVNNPEPEVVTRRGLGLFGKLVQMCGVQGSSFTIGFDTGKRVPGNLAIDEDGKLKAYDEIPEEDFVYGPQGFTVMVGGQSFAGENGDPELYSDLEQVAEAGLGILWESLVEEGGEEYAKAFFGEYLNLT
jgi:hypothetical protein